MGSVKKDALPYTCIQTKGMYLRNLISEHILHRPMLRENPHALKRAAHNNHVKVALCAAAIGRVFVRPCVVSVLARLVNHL